MVASNTVVTSLKIPVSRGTEKEERKISLTTEELRAQSHGKATWKHLVWAHHDIFFKQEKIQFPIFQKSNPFFLFILIDLMKIGLIKTLVIYAFHYLSSMIRSLLCAKIKLAEMILWSYWKLLKREMMKMQSHGNTIFLFS